MNRAPQSAWAGLYQHAGSLWQFLERLRASQRVDRLAELPLERLLMVRQEGILSPLLYALDLGGPLGDSVTQMEAVPVSMATEAAVARLPSWPEPAPDHTTAPGVAAAMALARTPRLTQAAHLVLDRAPAFTQEEASRQPPATPPTGATGMAISAERAWHDWAARVEAHPELRAAWQQPLHLQPGVPDNASPGLPLATARPQLPVAAAAVVGHAPATAAINPARPPQAPVNVLEQMERTLRRLEVDGSAAQRSGVRDTSLALAEQKQNPAVVNLPLADALLIPPLAPPPAPASALEPMAAAASPPAPAALPPPGASRGLRRLLELSRPAMPPGDTALMNGTQPAESQGKEAGPALRHSVQIAGLWRGEDGQSVQTAHPDSVAGIPPTVLDEAQFADLLARLLRREAERYGIQMEELAP
jgi:hypothetical protein